MERETKVEETIEEKDKLLGGKKIKRKIESEHDHLEPKKIESREVTETTEREL